MIFSARHQELTSSFDIATSHHCPEADIALGLPSWKLRILHHVVLARTNGSSSPRKKVGVHIVIKHLRWVGKHADRYRVAGTYYSWSLMHE